MSIPFCSHKNKELLIEKIIIKRLNEDSKLILSKSA